MLFACTKLWKFQLYLEINEKKVSSIFWINLKKNSFLLKRFEAKWKIKKVLLGVNSLGYKMSSVIQRFGYNVKKWSF